MSTSTPAQVPTTTADQLRWIQEGSPEGPLVTTDFFFDHELRNRTLVEELDLIDNLIPPGCTAIVGDSGLGKTWLAVVAEHHLAYGTELKGWPAREAPTNCLILDGESSLSMVQDRSYAVSTELPTDDGVTDSAGHITYCRNSVTGHPCMPPGGGYSKIAYLRQVLTESRDAGHPFGYVRIDTFEQFIGDPPPKMSKPDWQTRCSWLLNQLAIEFGVAIVVLHHTNKTGDYSGAVGFKGGLSAMICLVRNEEDPAMIHCRTTKMRTGRAYDRAMSLGADGVPYFTSEMTATQARYDGLGAIILEQMTKTGPASPQDMANKLKHWPEFRPAHIKRTMRRMAERGDLKKIKNLYHDVAAAPSRCAICQKYMAAYEPGQTTHPCCVIPEPRTSIEGGSAVVTPPVVVEDANDDDVAPTVWRGRRELAKSIRMAGSEGCHKTTVIPVEQRGEAPWTLMAESMNGHFNWSMKVNDNQRVAVLDRNAAYFAACANVPVAMGKLVHTGRAPDMKLRAGIYLINPVAWTETDMPHPLGRSAGNGVDPIWITRPHLNLLNRLAREGRVSEPVVLDSWTGAAMQTLFEAYSNDVRTQKETVRALGDDDAYVEFKQEASKGLRALWPIGTTGSPFWRPDWYLSILAEAMVRHWAGADKARLNGEVVVGLRVTDEMAFLMPEDAGDDWFPEGLKEGLGYGQLKRDAILSGKEWNRECR